MKLQAPFAISARLLPAIKIGDAWLSFDPQTVEFYLDRPGHPDYTIDDFRPGYSHNIQMCFADILSFMGAAGDSRGYREWSGQPGENEDLFPPEIVDWIVENLEDIDCYRMELGEGPELIT